MEERDVTAKNKVQPPTSASGGTPGVALNASGQPIQADKTSTNNESGGGSISSAATTRAGSSLGQAQSRASSKTTLGGRGEPKGLFRDHNDSLDCIRVSPKCCSEQFTDHKFLSN